MRAGAVILAFFVLSQGAAPAPSPVGEQRAGRSQNPGDAPLASQPRVRSAPQARAPHLQAEVDTTLVTVGDPVTLRVSVDHARGTTVAWPDSLALGPFEVLVARASGPNPADDLFRSSLTLTLAAYELGDLEIPSFRVAVVGAPGDSTVLSTDRFGIRVESVGLDEGGDIRGLKGPLGIPLSPSRIALWALALLLAGALSLAAYRRLRRRDTGPLEAARAAPRRPPHEVALEALARLEASPLLERGEVKEYHIQASDILRTYAEGRFGVTALEMTTRDILAGMERVGAEPSVREGFRGFLDRCDLVKFAKHRPDDGASREVLSLGRRLVEETIPPAEATTAGALGGRAGEPASVDSSFSVPEAAVADPRGTPAQEEAP